MIGLPESSGEDDHRVIGLPEFFGRGDHRVIGLPDLPSPWIHTTCRTRG